MNGNFRGALAAQAITTPGRERAGSRVSSLSAGASVSPEIARLDQLTLCRGEREILRDVSLSFAEGSITAIVGPSGVGKTSLMGALNGLLKPASGTISMHGIGTLTSPRDWREARRLTATIFQDHALIDRLPAIDNVLLGLADVRHPLSPLPWPQALRTRAALALEDVGLMGRATERTSCLSGGERQRVGIARALVRRPRLLLGDEPFASLDLPLARRLGEELRRLVLRDGLTVVLVLHQLQIARTLADRIVGIAAGTASDRVASDRVSGNGAGGNGAGRDGSGRVVYDGPASSFDSLAEERVFGLPESCQPGPGIQPGIQPGIHTSGPVPPDS